MQWLHSPAWSSVHSSQDCTGALRGLLGNRYIAVRITQHLIQQHSALCEVIHNAALYTCPNVLFVVYSSVLVAGEVSDVWGDCRKKEKSGR